MVRASRPKKRRPPRLRAVLLSRVSTSKPSQDKSGPRQIAELREIALRRGWKVIDFFSDRLSGSEYHRPGLEKAVDLICRGGADLLAVHELDRLGRDVRDMLAQVDKIHAAGGHFYIREGNIDTTSPEGRLHFTILAALAEFQRRSNSHKVLAGLAHARKKGVRLGRPPALPPTVVARAVELRRRRPRPSWREIVRVLSADGHGLYAKGTVAGAVTRAMGRPTPGRRP